MSHENWHHKVSCVLWRFIMCTWLALEFTVRHSESTPFALVLWFSRERKAAPRYRRLLSTLSKHADPSLFTIDTAISKRQEFYSFHFKNFGNTKLFLFTDLFFLFHYWRKLRGKSWHWILRLPFSYRMTENLKEKPINVTYATVFCFS